MHPGPALRTGIGLGVKPTLRRHSVLGLALHAHPKDAHAGVRPIIGDRAHDRQPRPAVGAVGEGVTIAAIARVLVS